MPGQTNFLHPNSLHTPVGPHVSTYVRYTHLVHIPPLIQMHLHMFGRSRSSLSLSHRLPLKKKQEGKKRSSLEKKSPSLSSISISMSLLHFNLSSLISISIGNNMFVPHSLPPLLHDSQSIKGFPEKLSYNLLQLKSPSRSDFILFLLSSYPFI